MVVGTSLLEIATSFVVQELAKATVTPPSPSSALSGPQLLTVAEAVDMDALDAVVMAGEALGVVVVAVAVVDVAVAVGAL
jgi:hypothetical protein